MSTTESIHDVTICIGANCRGGVNVPLAVERLSAMMSDAVSSGIYATPPEGNSHGEYTNAVMTGVTDMDYESFVASVKRLELEFGRDDACRVRGDVPLDVDVVIWDGVIMRPRDYSSSYFKKGVAYLRDALMKRAIAISR